MNFSFLKIEGPRDFEAYDKFVSSCPQSVTQQTLAWKRVIEGIWPDKDAPLYMRAESESGKIIGVLPSFIYDGSAGKIAVSLPHAGAYGGILTHPNLPPAERTAVYAGLSKAWFEECRKEGCLTATFATAPFSNDLNYYLNGVKPDYRLDRFFQYVDLKACARYNRRTRRNLRTALKEGLEVYKDNSMRAVKAWYPIHELRMKDLNAPPLPWKLFEGCVKHACPAGKADFWFVRDSSGKLVSGCLYLKHNEIVDVFIMSADTSCLTQNPNTILTDVTIKAYAKEGFKWYNWQASASKQCGVYEFKAGFGSLDGDHYYLTKALGDLARLRALTVQQVKDNYKWHYVLPFSEFSQS